MTNEAIKKNFKENQMKFFNGWAKEDSLLVKEKPDFWSNYNYYFEKKLQFFSNLTSFELILDLGCGSGKNVETLSVKAERVVGIDISRESIVIAHENYSNGKFDADFLVADGEYLPFCSSAFSGVASIHVFHHTPNFKQVLKEIQRITKNKGYILIIDLSSDNLLINFARKSWTLVPSKSKVVDLQVDEEIPEKTAFSKTELKTEFNKLRLEVIQIENRDLFLFVFYYLTKLFPFTNRFFTEKVLFSIYNIETRLLGGPFQRFAHAIVAILEVRK